MNYQVIIMMKKECDNITIYDYLIHGKLFNKEEFYKMCEQGLMLKETRDCFGLKRYLINKYEFKEIKPVASYEFEEE